MNIPTQAKSGLEWATRERKKQAATAVLDTAFAKSDVQKTPEGLEIPVPTEDQFLGDLKKASRKKH